MNMKYENCCGAVVFNNSKVLIIKHKLGHVSFPKGHVEENESKKETAIREVKEETGIDIEIISDKEYYVQYPSGDNSIEKVTYFIGKMIDGEIIPQLDEAKACYFIDENKVGNLITYENDKNMYLNILDDIKKGEI